MLPSQISYKDLQVRLQTLGCCLGDKTAIYNEALELGKDCSDKLEKLAYAVSLYKVIRDYNTNLVLIPEITNLVVSPLPVILTFSVKYAVSGGTDISAAVNYAQEPLGNIALNGASVTDFEDNFNASHFIDEGWSVSITYDTTVDGGNGAILVFTNSSLTTLYTSALLTFISNNAPGNGRVEITQMNVLAEYETIQAEVAYENQEDGNCITIEQADIIFQYLQDYCKDCFREYGYYDTGILPSNDSGGWVGSSGIYVVSRQIQANWTQTNTDAVDYIKNKSIAGYLESGSNITITGSGTIADPYIISSSGGGGGGSMVYPGAGIPVSTGSAWGTSITNNSSNWNTAYGWGNHASAGYLTASSTDTLTNKSGNISMWSNDSGYITSAALSGYATESWVTTQLSGYMLKSTYDTDNDGVVDSAQSMMTIGRNSTGSILYKGTIVYISGSTGNRPNFVKAQANEESTSAGTFGVVYADIANNSDGYVVTIGTINTLDTRITAANPFTSDILADGNTIYLSPDTAGYVTNIKPTAPNHIVYLGKVVKTSPTQGTIVYRVQNGYELDELHDVQATSPNSNDILYYDGTNRLWKTASLTSILGYTPVSTAGSYVNPSWITSLDYSKLTSTPTIPSVGTWGGLNYPNWSSGTPFVKMTAAGTFALDTNTYLTSVGTGTTNELTYWSGTNTLGSLTTATYPSLTELSYVKGVTSAIQTQLDSKQGSLTLTTTGTSGAATLVGSTLNIPQYSGGGGISDGDKGDITVTSSGATWTIDNNVVTNAKAAQMAANTIKANNTGATANASDINMDAFQTMLSNYTTNSTGSVLTNITTTNIKNFRVTAATGLGSFNNGVSGKDIEVFNNTGSSIIIYNEYVTEATATKRIYTGGQNVTLPNLKVAVFTYNTDISRWVLKVAGGDTYFPTFAGTGTRIVSSDANGNTSATYDVINPTLSHQYTALTNVTNTTKTIIWGANLGSLTIPTEVINRLGARIWAKHRHDLTTGAVPANITFDLDWGSTNLFTSGATLLTDLIGSNITGGSVDTEVYVNTSVIGATGTLTGFVIFKFFSSTGLQISSYSKNFSTGSVNLTADQLLTLSITFSSGAVNTWTSKNGCIILQN